VQLLSAVRIEALADSLLAPWHRAPSTDLAAVCRALEQAALHDGVSRTVMRGKSGLAVLPNAQEARNVILSDDEVAAFVAAAYRLDEKFGLFADRWR